MSSSVPTPSNRPDRTPERRSAGSTYEPPQLTRLGTFSALTLQQTVPLSYNLADDKRLFGLIK